MLQMSIEPEIKKLREVLETVETLYAAYTDSEFLQYQLKSLKEAFTINLNSLEAMQEYFQDPNKDIESYKEKLINVQVEFIKEALKENDIFSKFSEEDQLEHIFNIHESLVNEFNKMS